MCYFFVVKKMVSCSYYLLKLLQKSREERKQKDTMPKTKRSKENGTNNKCRTCLEKGTIPIIEDGKALNIREAIKIIADIEVNEDDEFPKYLCHECYSLLRGAMLFKKLAQQTDKLLRNSKRESTPPLDSPATTRNASPDRDSTPDIPPTSHGSKQDTAEDKNTELHGRRENSLKPIKRKRNVYVETSDEKMKCDVCSKEMTKRDYKIHLEYNHCTPCIDSKPINLKTLRVECNLCKKTLHNQWVVKHFSTVHSVAPQRNYVCDICGNSYLYKAGLHNHAQLHSKEFPYKCPVCPYRGKTSTNLKAHSRMHSTDYKFKCTECPAKYRHWSQLNMHKRKHRAPEVKCVECTKLFHTPMAMEKHYKVHHMGIKSHVCTICNTAYSYRKSLITHQNRVHNRMRLPSGGTPAYLRTENKTEDD